MKSRAPSANHTETDFELLERVLDRIAERLRVQAGLRPRGAPPVEPDPRLLGDRRARRARGPGQHEHQPRDRREPPPHAAERSSSEAEVVEAL